VRPLIIVLAAGAVAGCGGGTDPIVPAQVSLAPLSDTIEVGWTVNVTATATDAAGLTLTTADFEWQSSNSATLTVEGLGANAVVRGVRAGTALVTARCAGVGATAEIRVVEAQPSASGRWVGTGREPGAVSQVVINLDMSVNESGEGGGLGGTGRIQGPGDVAADFTLSGARVGTTIQFTMRIPGFQPFVFKGTYRDTTMTGRIDGSGFTNLPTTLRRTAPSGAGAALVTELRVLGERAAFDAWAAAPR